MDTVNAQILKYRLGRLENIIERRRKNVNLYREILQIEEIVIPECAENEKTHLLCLLFWQMKEINSKIFR